MVHVGIDLDKRSSQIAVLTEDGELVQQRLTNEAGGLEKFFAQLPPQTPIAIEASGTWWWLVDLLEHLGHRPVLSHPKQTKAIAAARLKNDRVDAERLALLLRGDLPPTVWIPPAALREGANSSDTASNSSGCAAWRAIASRPCDQALSRRAQALCCESYEPRQNHPFLATGAQLLESAPLT